MYTEHTMMRVLATLGEHIPTSSHPSTVIVINITILHGTGLIASNQSIWYHLLEQSLRWNNWSCDTKNEFTTKKSKKYNAVDSFLIGIISSTYPLSPKCDANPGMNDFQLDILAITLLDRFAKADIHYD